MILKWLILIQLFFVLLPGPVNSSSSHWWIIEMQASVRGDYQLVRGNKPVSGHYQFQIFWQGSIERDNGDYILYQGGSKLLSWQWNEMIEGQVRDMSSEFRPELKFNYVVRREEKIHVDFKIRSLPKGSANSNPDTDILFPQSAEHEVIAPAVKYNRGVCWGSNEIAVIEDLIYKQSKIRKSINWDWNLKSPVLNHSHSIAVELKITRKQKK